MELGLIHRKQRRLEKNDVANVAMLWVCRSVRYALSKVASLQDSKIDVFDDVSDREDKCSDQDCNNVKVTNKPE